MNQGKYNEDRLVGAPLKFPTTTEAVQNLLKQIGIDGIRYEEIFIASYDGPMPISVKIIVTTGEKYGILAAWKS